MITDDDKKKRKRRGSLRQDILETSNAAMLFRNWVTDGRLNDEYRSRYRPSNEQDASSEYWTLPGVRDKVFSNVSGLGSSFNSVYQALGNESNQRRSIDSWELGHFRVTPGQDDRGRYISYYDSYDWNALPGVGKPIEIYDRIYENEYNTMSNRTYADGGAIGEGVGSAAGTIAGQALIPIPGVGAAVGGFLGGTAGKFIGGMFGESAADKENRIAALRLSQVAQDGADNLRTKGQSSLGMSYATGGPMALPRELMLPMSVRFGAPNTSPVNVPRLGMGSQSSPVATGGAQDAGDVPEGFDYFNGLVSSLLQQESGGDYKAIGPPTRYGRALGRYQVLPENVRRWGKEILGREISTGEYLRDPELQDRIAQGKLRQIYDNHLNSTGDPYTAFRMAAAEWYSGDGKNHDDYREGSWTGPSRGSYVDQIASRAGIRPASGIQHTYASGGTMTKKKLAAPSAVSIGQDALLLTGPSHEKGGVQLAPGHEAEGGETVDFLTKKGQTTRASTGTPYIFSKRLKVPGSNLNFARAHEQLVKRNAGDDAINDLANLQEKVSGRNGADADGNYNWGGVLNTVGSFLKSDTGKNLLSTGLQMAPSLMNVGVAAFAKDGTPTYAPRTVSDAALKRVEQTPTEIDINPALNENRVALRTLTSQPGVSVAQARSAMNQTQANAGQMYAQKANTEAGLKADKASKAASIMAQTEGANAAALNQAQQINMENQMGADAARQNMMMQGVAGMANVYQQSRLENQNRDMQEASALLQWGSVSPAVQERLRPALLSLGISVPEQATPQQIQQAAAQAGVTVAELNAGIGLSSGVTPLATAQMAPVIDYAQVGALINNYMNRPQ